LNVTISRLFTRLVYRELMPGEPGQAAATVDTS
jgi:hypothetical protein